MACILGDRGSPRMLRRAQGPRPELHSALEPADDLAAGHSPAPCVEQVVLVGESLDRGLLPRCRNSAIWSAEKRGPSRLPSGHRPAVGLRGLSRS